MATAPDSAPTERMEELLTCCICKETLEEPITLPCFHSFCKKCLARYIEIQREEAQKEHRAQQLFNCPTCRTQFELIEGESVERLPPNYFINNMLDILKIQQQAQKLPCESCKAQLPGTCRCFECESYLCRNCLTTHNKWPAFKGHSVLSLEELAKPVNQAKAKGKSCCQKYGHEKKPHAFYCNTCQELACIHCVVLNHPKPDHACQAIDVVAEQYKEALKTTSAILQKKSNEGQTALQKIEYSTRNLQANTKAAKDVIQQQEKEILEEFTKKLKRNTAVLLGKVDRKHDEVDQKLVKQHDDMKAYVEKVNCSLEFAKNIIEKGSSEEILSLGKEIEANASNIKTGQPEMMLPVHYGEIGYQARSVREVGDTVKLDNLGNIACAPFRKPVDPVVVQSLVKTSRILNGNIDLAQQLAHWMEGEKFGWQLCYRASDDGWRGKDFHRKCDDVGPTLTLVKCETNVFGGYTDKSWKPRGQFGDFKHSDVSFLFSLQNKDNWLSFKCPIYDHQNDTAILCFLEWGAVFGSGGYGLRCCDLFINDNANTSQDSFSNLGHTYQPPSGYQPGSPETKALLAGSHKFRPTEIEVFCC